MHPARGHLPRGWKLAALGAILGLAATSQAQTTRDLNISGYIRAEYGDGDRYPAEKGGDSFDVSQISVGLTAIYENLEAFVNLGATNVLEERSPSSDVFVTDAFITWKGGASGNLIAGLQPILFGLKPAGFAGDRSIQAGLEYGGAGGFAVSQQAAPAIVYQYGPGTTFSIKAGAFDTSSSTVDYQLATGLGPIDGSSLSDNFFFDLRFGQAGTGGLYGYAGWEDRYIGGAVNEARDIVDIGVGWSNSKIDISVEYIDLDQAFFGLTESETYTIAEATFHLSQRVNLYFDLGEADVTDRETTRYGLVYAINPAAALQIEFSKDEFGSRATLLPEGVVAGQDIDSVDFRLSFSF